MESEQGYIVALCLPNLPHEKHRLVSYGKCALPTKTLKGLAEWALGYLEIPGSVHLKRRGEQQSVPQTPGKEASQSSPGRASGQFSPINSRILLITNFTSNYRRCSETSCNLEYFTTFTNTCIDLYIYPLLTYIPSKYLYPFVRYKQTKCTRNTLHKGLLLKKSLSYRNDENGLEIKKMQRCACLFMFCLPVEYFYLHFEDRRNFHRLREWFSKRGS